MENSCDWSEYERRVIEFNKEQQQTDPGYFSKDVEQRFYEQVCAIPLINDLKNQMPFLTLPLTIHLIKSDLLGCSDHLNEDSLRFIVEDMNRYWTQAGIVFELQDVVEHCLGDFMPVSEQQTIQEFITRRLTRGQDGKMQNKQKRGDIFLGQILSQFQSSSKNCCSYSVWFFHFIGQKSQGFLACPKTNTVIMSESSNKGYDRITRRPYPCLAKTMAHELGHALGLGHPRGMTFLDGSRRSHTIGRRNLMGGGQDLKGGGGDFLEDWQIVLTREFGRVFLDDLRLKMVKRDT